MEYEYLTKHRSNPKTASIQKFYNDGTNIAICVMTLRQAQAFQKVQDFQVDMTFSRVRGEISEVVFSYLDSVVQHGKSQSY